MKSVSPHYFWMLKINSSGLIAFTKSLQNLHFSLGNSAMHQEVSQKLLRGSAVKYYYKSVSGTLGFSSSLAWWNDSLDERYWIFSNYLCHKYYCLWEHTFTTKGKTEKLRLLDGYHVLKPYYVLGTGLRTFHALSHLNPKATLNYYPILSGRKTALERQMVTLKLGWGCLMLLPVLLNVIYIICSAYLVWWETCINYTRMSNDGRYLSHLKLRKSVRFYSEELVTFSGLLLVGGEGETEDLAR